MEFIPICVISCHVSLGEACVRAARASLNGISGVTHALCALGYIPSEDILISVLSTRKGTLL